MGMHFWSQNWETWGQGYVASAALQQVQQCLTRQHLQIIVPGAITDRATMAGLSCPTIRMAGSSQPIRGVNVCAAQPRLPSGRVPRAGGVRRSPCNSAAPSPFSTSSPCEQQQACSTLQTGADMQQNSWFTSLRNNALLAALVLPAMLWGAPAHARAVPQQAASTATIAPAAVSTVRATWMPQQAMQAVQEASPLQLFGGSVAALLMVLAVTKARPSKAETADLLTSAISAESSDTPSPPSHTSASTPPPPAPTMRATPFFVTKSVFPLAPPSGHLPVPFYVTKLASADESDDVHTSFSTTPAIEATMSAREKAAAIKSFVTATAVVDPAARTAAAPAVALSARPADPAAARSALGYDKVVKVVEPVVEAVDSDTLPVSNVVATNLARAVNPHAPVITATHQAAHVSLPIASDGLVVSDVVKHNLAAAAKFEILGQLKHEAAKRNGTQSHSPNPSSDSKHAATATEASVHNWTTMVRASPASAAAAVAEATALAEAVVRDLDAGKDLGGVKTMTGLPPPDAAMMRETAAALHRPNWMWTWRWALQTRILDPVRNMLTLRPPTGRSKYDPIQFGTWSAPQGKYKFDPLSDLGEWSAPTMLPFWDPLARLRELAPRRDANGQPLPPGRYDAVGQLLQFMQQLPELVKSTEWAAASAADPVRLLIAESAYRPTSTILAASRNPWQPPKRRKSKWSKYDPLAALMGAAVSSHQWRDVVADILQLEAVCGPKVPNFSPIKVLTERDGKAFADALADFKRVAVSGPGAEQFAQQFPAISAWLQAASNVSLATCAGGVKLGPVWGLLQLPTHQASQAAAKEALPQLMKHLQHKHFSLHSLLNQGSPQQALTLLAILAAWVVEDELAATGKPPVALTGTTQPTTVHIKEEPEGLFGGLKMFSGSQMLANLTGAGNQAAADASKKFAPATTSRNQ